MNVDAAIAVPEHLQGVGDVLPLLGDDRLAQHFEGLAAEAFSRHVRAIETDEPIALLHAQQAIEFVLMTACAELAQHGVSQVRVVLEHLQTVRGRVQTGIDVADHQRTGQLDILGLVLPDPHVFDGRATGR